MLASDSNEGLEYILISKYDDSLYLEERVKVKGLKETIDLVSTLPLIVVVEFVVPFNFHRGKIRPGGFPTTQVMHMHSLLLWDSMVVTIAEPRQE